MSSGLAIFLAPLNLGASGPTEEEFQMYDEGSLVSISMYDEGAEVTMEVLHN